MGRFYTTYIINKVLLLVFSFYSTIFKVLLKGSIFFVALCAILLSLILTNNKNFIEAFNRSTLSPNILLRVGLFYFLMIKIISSNKILQLMVIGSNPIKSFTKSKLLS